LELPCHLNCPQGLILQPAAAREGQSCQLLDRSPFSSGLTYVSPYPLITLVSSGLLEPPGVGVEVTDDVYIAVTHYIAIEELARTFQDPTREWANAAGATNAIFLESEIQKHYFDRFSPVVTTCCTCPITPVKSVGLWGRASVGHLHKHERKPRQKIAVPDLLMLSWSVRQNP
jgi:hypothetical protein